MKTKKIIYAVRKLYPREDAAGTVRPPDECLTSRSDSVCMLAFAY